MKAKAYQGEFSKNSLLELMSLSSTGISPAPSGTLLIKKNKHFKYLNSGIYSKNRAINLDSKGFT